MRKNISQETYSNFLFTEIHNKLDSVWLQFQIANLKYNTNLKLKLYLTRFNL